MQDKTAVEPGHAVSEYARKIVTLGEMEHSTLNQSAIFVGVFVGFLNVLIIRLRSLLLAAAISSLI